MCCRFQPSHCFDFTRSNDRLRFPVYGRYRLEVVLTRLGIRKRRLLYFNLRKGILVPIFFNVINLL